jgi:hypothetical protein
MMGGFRRPSDQREREKREKTLFLGEDRPVSLRFNKRKIRKICGDDAISLSQTASIRKKCHNAVNEPQLVPIVVLYDRKIPDFCPSSSRR